MSGVLNWPYMFTSFYVLKIGNEKQKQVAQLFDETNIQDEWIDDHWINHHSTVFLYYFVYDRVHTRII